MSHEWIELVDPKSAKPFYANIKTGNCTWEKPDGISFDGNSNNHNIEWWELYDNKHDMPYYYNTKTKFTDWVRPEGVEIISLIKLQQATILKNVSRNSIIKYEVRNDDTYVDNDESCEPSLNFIDNTENHRVSVIVDNITENSSDESQESNLSNENIDEIPGGHTQILPVSMKFEHYKRLSSEIICHIKNYGFDEYAKKNFMEHRRGIFRKKIPIENLLCWSKKSIRKPLLKSSRIYYKDALHCFSLIQRILGDKYSNGKLDDIQKLVDIGLNNAGIRDEIYCQVCKQLNKNPNFGHIVLGWKLMSVLVIAFPPSRDFEDYLKCFIEKYTHTNWITNLINDSLESKAISALNYDKKENVSDGKNSDEDNNEKDEESEIDERVNTIKTLSQHCYRKLSRTCIVGPRGKSLSLKEIEQRMNAAFNFSYFGETLEDIMEEQRKEQGSDLEVPEILIFLTDSIINLNGCQTEGIFRVPGDVDSISELRYQIEKKNFDLNGCIDPSVPASLLKLWLRELAEPLIPAFAYEECIEIGKNECEDNAGMLTYELIESLPEINRLVIRYMVDFLKIVAKPENQKHTKMTLANLAMIFAPNFLRCPSDDPQTIFENTKYEQAFMRVLISN